MPECLCYIFHNVICTFFIIISSTKSHCKNISLNDSSQCVQMAYELHGLLAGNVSIVTGENIRPSYGGDEEAFLKKVVTPIYRVIRKVL